jgi:hypothetical protein
MNTNHALQEQSTRPGNDAVVLLYAVASALLPYAVAAVLVLLAQPS